MQPSNFVVKESLRYLPGKVAVACGGLLFVPMLAMFFPDPSHIASYDLSLRLAQFLYFAFILWLDPAIVRFYATFSKRHRLDIFFTVILAWRIIGIFLGVSVLMLASILGYREYVLPPDARLLPIIALFAGMALFETDLSLMRVERRPWRFSLTQITTTLSKFLVGFPLVILFKCGIDVFLWVTALSMIAIHLTFGKTLAEKRRLMLSKEDHDFFKESLRYGIPLGLSALIGFLLRSNDRFLLKIITGNDEMVGLFAVGAFWGEQPVYILSTTLILAVSPEIVRTYEGSGREETERLLFAATRVFLIVVTLVGGMVVGVSEYLFTEVIGGKMREAWGVVPVIVISTSISCLSHYASQGLYLGKKTNELLYYGIIAVATSILSSVVFINWLGYIGIGYSRLLSAVVLLILYTTASRRFVTWSVPVVSLLRLCFAGVSSAFSMYLIGHSLLNWGGMPIKLLFLGVFVIVGLSCYILALLLLKEVSFREVRNLTKLVVGKFATTK